MTISIKASVISCRSLGLDGPEWFVAIFKIDGSNWMTPSQVLTHRYSPSWPEAMQLAYKLLHDTERDLMDEIHESRSSRRIESCPACRGLSLTHIYKNDCDSRRERVNS